MELAESLIGRMTINMDRVIQLEATNVADLAVAVEVVDLEANLSRGGLGEGDGRCINYCNGQLFVSVLCKNKLKFDLHTRINI